MSKFHGGPNRKSVERPKSISHGMAKKVAEKSPWKRQGAHGKHFGKESMETI